MTVLLSACLDGWLGFYFAIFSLCSLDGVRVAAVQRSWIGALCCLHSKAPVIDWIRVCPGLFCGLGQLFAWIAQGKRVSNCLNCLTAARHEPYRSESPMYQRIVEFTRTFRERWISNNIVSLSMDAISTADAASNPTICCVFGRGGIFFAVEPAFASMSAGAGECCGR